jgi:hypothetical protein
MQGKARAGAGVDATVERCSTSLLHLLAGAINQRCGGGSRSTEFSLIFAFTTPVIRSKKNIFDFHHRY